MNTNKQILAMVVLLFLGVVSLGAYTWFEAGTRTDAADFQAVEAAERGALLFAKNCRVCHGNVGLGRVGHPQLIGLALNDPANTLAFRSEDENKLAEIQARFRDTIACGRNGTTMPAWAIDQGGSLNFAHIANLAALVSTNAGNAWDHALEIAIEEDEATLESLAATLRAAQGDDAAAADAQAALDDAHARVGSGLPLQEATPSLTENTCGQRSSAAAPTTAAAPVEVEEIDTSGFTVDADRVPDEDVFAIYSWLQTLE